MKRRLHLWIGCVMLAFAGAAAAKDSFSYEGQELALREKARVCYLGFIPVYDAYYYDAGSGKVTGAPACVRLVYSRNLEAEILAEGTRKIFDLRHGDAAAADNRQYLDRVAMSYQDVAPGDDYAFCIGERPRGALLRNGRAVLDFHDADFAERYMGLWITGAGTAAPRWAVETCG